MTKEKHAKPYKLTITEVIVLYWLIFIIGCFLGFSYETINDYVCGRGFMLRASYIGPWCPIYGIGCVVLSAIFTPVKEAINNKILKLLATTIGIAIVVTLIELAASYICEIIMGYCPWDYSDYWLNFNGRIAFKSTLIFVIGGSVMLYLINPLLKRLVENNLTIALTITMITLALFIADTILEFVGIDLILKTKFMTMNPAITMQGL